MDKRQEGYFWQRLLFVSRFSPAFSQAVSGMHADICLPIRLSLNQGHGELAFPLSFLTFPFLSFLLLCLVFGLCI